MSAADKAGPGNRGVSRVLKKLESSVNSQNWYEAHQMYRTIYFRYLSQKNFVELLDLLYKGAVTLLNNDQLTSGADLGLLLIDTLEKSKIEDFDFWISRIAIILTKIGPTVVERENLLAKSVRWSSEASNCKNKMGHPLLHKLIAEIMWSEMNLEQARLHYLLSKDGAGCGQMLIELSQNKGYSSETDLFIVQIVFQQLCLKETITATQTFETYTKFHPKISATEPPFLMPILNFTFFLLESIENGKQLAVFKSLCELYKPSLDRDPAYEKYLQKIGILFFGAPAPQQASSGGIFGNLINQIFQGLEDEPRTSEAAEAGELD